MESMPSRQTWIILLVAISVNTLITLALLRRHETSLMEKIAAAQSPPAATPVVEHDQQTPAQRDARREEIARQVRAIADRFIGAAKLDAEQSLRLRQLSEKYIAEISQLNGENLESGVLTARAAELQAKTNKEIESLVSAEQYLLYLRLLNQTDEN